MSAIPRKLKLKKMPTTRKELCEYVNNILRDVHDNAQLNGDRWDSRTVTIKGNSDFICDYIETMCSKYNDKHNLWQCTYQYLDDDKYEISVSHTSDDDEYGWYEDEDDGPLEPDEE